MAVAAGADPLVQLAADRAQARELADPCANVCTLATVDAAGHPHARTVILRDIEGRLAVFLNETSPKWLQLEHSASLALVVWLPSLNLQYRLQCQSRPVAKQQVQESWQLRPDAPKRLDWFYTRVQPQSSAVEGRQSLLDQIGELQLRQPLVAPRTAAGIYLEPVRVERLDLGMAEGIHDRRSFQRRADGWHELVLVP
ncbi:MAG: pyridoxamine 5'-phosphate oxidase family protein [Pseudomonadales bacterium]